MSLMGSEQWRAVVGYENLYEVSSHGRVRSLPHRTRHGCNRRGKILAVDVQWTTYHRVTLYRDGQRDRRMVHILMLEAFVGPCPEGMEACHQNDAGGDNRLENLRWDTRRNNWLDRVRLGTAKNIGEGCKTAKLTNLQVREIRFALHGKTPQRVLAQRYAVSPAMINHIATGRAWRFIE